MLAPDRSVDAADAAGSATGGAVRGRLRSVLTVDEELREAERRLHALTALEPILDEPLPLERMAPRLLAMLGETFSWAAASCFAAAGDGTLVPAGRWSAQGAAVAAAASRALPPSPPRPLHDREHAWMIELERGEAPRHGEAPDGARVAWGFAVHAGGALLGTFEFIDVGPARPAGALLATLSAVARRIGRELETRQSLEAARASERQLRALVETDRAVYWLFSVDDRRLLYLSPRFEELWGIPCVEALARPNEVLWERLYH
jgi:PAS domain-containing protein